MKIKGQCGPKTNSRVASERVTVKSSDKSLDFCHFPCFSFKGYYARHVFTVFFTCPSGRLHYKQSSGKHMISCSIHYEIYCKMIDMMIYHDTNLHDAFICIVNHMLYV